MFRSLLIKIPVIALALFLTIILSGVIFYKFEFSYVPYGDTSVLLKQNLLILGGGLLIATLLFWQFWRLTEKYKDRDLLKEYWWVLLIYALLQLMVIYFFRINLTADWEVVYNGARQIMHSDLSSLQKGGYLYAYPNNLGLTVYFIILNYLFSGNIFVARIINVIFSVLGVIIINKLFVLINPEFNKERGRFFIYSVLFLPAIFMSNLVYNEVISTTLFLLTSYYAVKFTQKQNNKTLILTAIFLSLANFFRGIGLLFVLSIIIFFIIKNIRLVKISAFILLAFIGISLPLTLTNIKYYSSGLIGEPLGKNSAPITKWVHMGLTEKYFGYWDQGESYWMYARDAGGNKNSANLLFIQGLKNKYMSYGLWGVSKIYFKKLVWLFTEGTYQSVYLGMSHTSPGGYSQITPVSEFFDQKIQRRDIFKLPMYLFNILSLLSILAFLCVVVYKRRWDQVASEIYLISVFLIFILFYLIWEVKPRYIYPLYPYVLILAFIAITKLTGRRKKFQ